jgi:hypothetical protein
MQHHDAITGTMRGAVLLDYIAMVEKDMVNVQAILPTMISVLMSTATRLKQAFESNSVSLPRYSMTPSWKALADQTKHSVVVLYNPVSWTSKRIVMVIVPEARVRVVDNNGDEVMSQV